MLEELAGGKVMLTRELAARLGVPTDNIRSAGKLLAGRGYIFKMEGCYQITDNRQDFVASEAERMPGVQKGDFAARSRFSLRTRVWNLIRIRSLWSVDDLLMTLADGTEKDAEKGLKRYIRALLKAGYVERTPRNQQIFRLVRNTGRLAPALNYTDRSITDSNTGEVHHV